MKRSKLWSEVDKILWKDWDPIGINESAPIDEYRGYVPSILNLLIQDANVSEITKLLYQHANTNMGLSTDLSDHIETAQKLKNLIL